MAPSAMDTQPQRIAIEREEDWLRVQNNVKDKLKVLVDKRMASEDDPDGKLRREVEARIAEVGFQNWTRLRSTTPANIAEPSNDLEIRADLPVSSAKSAREWT